MLSRPLLSFGLLFVALCLPLTVSAVPITETARVGNKVWASLELFTGLSWNDINSQCAGGTCSGQLNGFDVDGWQWASIDDVGTLFSSFTPHQGGVFSVEQPDLSWETEFHRLGFNSPTSQQTFVFDFVPNLTINGQPVPLWANVNDWSGWTSTEFNDDIARIGRVRRTITSRVCAGCFPVILGGSTLVQTDVTAFKSVTQIPIDPPTNIGAWLFVTIPEPATLALFTLGIAGLPRPKRQRGAETASSRPIDC